MSQIRFRPYKKQVIIFGLVAGLLISVSVIYRFTSLQKPDQSLLTLLPDAPVCYVSIKDLGGFIKTFQRSEFGNQVAQMPILVAIERELWWQQIVYQKQLWEYETGGKLDLKKIRGYLGEEAILSFYKRGEEISFLLVSAVGAKEKLEIAALTATALVNPKYKRLKENYRKLDINTITGYPKDFSYAFIGKIGLLTTDKSLIQAAIDICAEEKKGFTHLRPIGNYLRKQYSADQNTVYIEPSKFAQVFAFGESLRSLSDGVSVWTFSNHYEEGVIHSRHRLMGKANWQSSLPKHSPRPIDKRLLSILPATTAFLSVSSDKDLAALWKQMNVNLSLQYEPSEINLSHQLKPGVALALLASPADAPAIIPSILLISPIKDRASLETNLMRLKQEKITLNGNPVQFLDPQDYQGIKVQPVQFRLGSLLSPKGGYALLDNYWAIGTNLTVLKAAIDALVKREIALTDIALPTQFDQPRHAYLLIQPNSLIPSLKRLTPILGLMASAYGHQIDSKLTMRVTNNLFPLEALGTIGAGINFNGDLLEAEVQIVLEEQ